MGQRVTVCIGALCEGRRAVVLAADRRITLGRGHHFDRENGKIVQLAPQILVAWSGDGNLGAELIETARTALNKSGTVTVRAAADALKGAWQRKHMQRVEDLFLKPRLHDVLVPVGGTPTTWGAALRGHPRHPEPRPGGGVLRLCHRTPGFLPHAALLLYTSTRPATSCRTGVRGVQTAEHTGGER